MIDLQGFTQIIRDQFLEDDPSKITTEIEFRTLSSWDSLTGMAVLATIEDEFKVKINVNDFKQMKTILDLFNFVNAQNKEI